MFNRTDVTVSVVESDTPTTVTMLNSVGGEIGWWSLNEWKVAIERGDIILQSGDKFVFE
jgi:hypothetical protein